MAGLAAVTTRIKLFATIGVLTMPPPIVARMAVTIDSISHGRFGVNIISGWQEKEYSQMGIWPGDEHYRQRYEYCDEYVTIMKELWATGRSDFKGEFFQMDDCRCSPLPTAPITIVCAGQSDARHEVRRRVCRLQFRRQQRLQRARRRSARWSSAWSRRPSAPDANAARWC